MFKIKTLFSWHRYMGLTVALFVIVVASTGILLNHTEDFELDESYIQNDWLLKLYNIKSPDEISAYNVMDSWVSQVHDQVYLNERRIEQLQTPLVGVVKVADYIVIATTESLIIMTMDGERVENVGSAHGLPTPIDQLGVSQDEQLVVFTTQGRYRADIDELDWTDYSSASIKWSTKKSLPNELYSDIVQLYRGQDINVERVLLDIHSGRILPKLGIYIMDGAAILMMLLAISGVWVWYLKRTRKIKNKV